LLNTDFDPLKSILLPPCRKSIREAYTGSRLRDFVVETLKRRENLGPVDKNVDAAAPETVWGQKNNKE